MRITLAQLEAFYWIVRLGSFHSAARHLHLTQPTVSARLAELERSVGERLVDRGRPRATPTPRGRDVVELAESMLRMGDQLLDSSRVGPGLRGLLRLGAVESVGMLALPRLLPRLAVEHPELRVELTVDVGTTLNAKVRARELDLAIVSDPEGDSEVAVIPMGTIDLAWVAAPDSRLPRRPLTPADLAGLPVLANAKPSTTYAMTLEWFRSAGVEPGPIGTCNSVSVMARLVQAGVAIAILPPALLDGPLRVHRLRKLPTRPALRPRALGIAHHGSARALGSLPMLVRDALVTSGLVRTH